MYVCLCNRYRDSDILQAAEAAEAAEAGEGCARRTYDALGSGPRCGRCLDFAQSLIDGARGAAMAPASRHAA